MDEIEKQEESGVPSMRENMKELEVDEDDWKQNVR